MLEKNNKLSVAVILGLVLCILVLAVFYKPVINVENGQQPVPDTLSVTGNSEIKVSPDKAVISVNIMTEKDNALSAQEENKAATAKVFEALKKDVKENDIETINYILEKKQEWDNDKQKNIDTGYKLTHTLKVTTTDIEDVGKIIDNAIKAGANGIESVSFELMKETEMKYHGEAIVKATESAKDKAKKLALGLDIELGKISSVYENTYYSGSYGMMPNFRMDAGAGSSTSIIAPQQVVIQGSVSISYKII